MPTQSGLHALHGVVGNWKPCCQVFLWCPGQTSIHWTCPWPWSPPTHNTPGSYCQLIGIGTGDEIHLPFLHMVSWFISSFPFHFFLSLMMFFYSSPSSDEFLRPVPWPSTFFFFTHFFPIPKSAFPAKAQMKSEFHVQMSNILQFHVVILPWLSNECVWSWTRRRLRSPHSLSSFQLTVLLTHFLASGCTFGFFLFHLSVNHGWSVFPRKVLVS